MQVALRHLGAAVDRVDVRVLEARGRAARSPISTTSVPGPDEVADVVRRLPTAHDPATGHRHRSGLGRGPEPGEDATADEDQICV